MSGHQCPSVGTAQYFYLVLLVLFGLLVPHQRWIRKFRVTFIEGSKIIPRHKVRWVERLGDLAKKQMKMDMEEVWETTFATAINTILIPRLTPRRAPVTQTRKDTLAET